MGLSITWVESWGNPEGSCEGGKGRQELQEKNPIQRHRAQGLILAVMGVSSVTRITDLEGVWNWGREGRLRMLLHLEFGSRLKGSWFQESLYHPSLRQACSHELKGLGAQR